MAKAHLDYFGMTLTCYFDTCYKIQSIINFTIPFPQHVAKSIVSGSKTPHLTHDMWSREAVDLHDPSVNYSGVSLQVQVSLVQLQDGLSHSKIMSVS